MSENKHVFAVFKQLSKNWDIDNEKFIKTTLKNRQNLNRRGAVKIQKKNTDDSTQTTESSCNHLSTPPPESSCNHDSTYTKEYAEYIEADDDDMPLPFD